MLKEIIGSVNIKVILEIPSGIFADKYSRKKILFIGNALFLISTLLFNLYF